MESLILYSRPGCHLCEEAAAMLAALAPDVTVTIVNIEDDDDLLRRYAISIPVLRPDSSGPELYWPFNEASLAEFLKR